jgi:hypothetical protein
MKFIETAGYRSLQKDGAFCNLRDSNYTVIHKNKTSFTYVMKLCCVYVHHSPWRYFKMSSFEYQVVWFNWINKWTTKSIWQFFQTPAHIWGYVIQNQFLQIFVSNLLFGFLNHHHEHQNVGTFFAHDSTSTFKNICTLGLNTHGPLLQKAVWPITMSTGLHHSTASVPTW